MKYIRIIEITHLILRIIFSDGSMKTQQKQPMPIEIIPICLKHLFRYKPGVPVTLAKASLKDKNCQVSLSPFPCWSLQEEGTCTSLQNVVDIYLDPEDVLWVLDTGVINSLEQAERRCPPKVVAFNVKTGKVR